MTEGRVVFDMTRPPERWPVYTQIRNKFLNL